ncbi:hypothetical protein WJX84_005646 [Apatococcus fuscideae]|uniref:Uncharacterized protein n=1 Tax=Apatococcus fuscideae TaxID=2026836 RepID=A0AAW1T6B7_9CHLO
MPLPVSLGNCLRPLVRTTRCPPRRLPYSHQQQEHKNEAARAFDKAAICLKRPVSNLNFPSHFSPEERHELQGRAIEELADELQRVTKEPQPSRKKLLRPMTKQLSACWTPSALSPEDIGYIYHCTGLRGSAILGRTHQV